MDKRPELIDVSVEPKLVIRNSDKLMSEKKSILKKDVSEKLVKILRKIVTDSEGTAGLANVEGYEIAGKTGTAEKVKDKEFSRNANRVSFVATFPANDPAFLIMMMIDEPDMSKGWEQWKSWYDEVQGQLFMVGGANAVISLVIRSPIPSNMVVPPDITMFA